MESKYSQRSFKLVRHALSPIMQVLFRPEIIGFENIPCEGPYIFAGNHKSGLDAPLLAIASKKEMHFIAKQELFNNKILASIFSKLGAIPIKRGQLDLKAVKSAITVLKNYEILAIFPEGTRVKGSELGEFKQGVCMLAVKADCPVIPFGISGEYKLGKRIKIQFGEAIKFQKEDIKNGNADKQLRVKVKELTVK